MADVPFQYIPQNLRVPLFSAEVNNSQANTGQQTQRALLIGSMIAAGNLVPNVAQICSGVADGKVKAGAGSILAAMNWAYRQNDTFGEVWLLGLSDAGGATAATGTFTFAGTATNAGAISAYIAGQLVSTPVTVGMTAAQCTAAMLATITGMPDLPVTAAVVGAVLTLTSKNLCLAANDIDLRVNYLGTAGGQVTPAGLTVAIVAMTGGTTTPSLTLGLANLNTEPFDFIACAYNDATSVAALTAFLNDQAGRWSWSVQIYGHYFYAFRGTVGAATTLGATVNDQHATCMPFYDSPSPVWNWAAAMAAQVAVSVRADPGVPVQTLPLLGILAPPIQSRFPLTIRNTLLYDGMSTFTVNAAGGVAIENMITTYRVNTAGAADDSYLEIETMFLLMYVLRALAGVVTTKFARVKLAADGSSFGVGANVVTPSTIRAEIIAQYGELEAGGYVQNATAFAAALVVQQNSQNPNRVDVLFPPSLINQLRIFAVLAQFRLT
jgi:phage tail sheath gpL-like